MFDADDQHYTQGGSVGGLTGTFSCTDGISGPMALTWMQMTEAGFTATFSVNVQQCNLVGEISGLRVKAP
jgi:hypothetical protein